MNLPTLRRRKAGSSMVAARAAGLMAVGCMALQLAEAMPRRQTPAPPPAALSGSAKRHRRSPLPGRELVVGACSPATRPQLAVIKSVYRRELSAGFRIEEAVRLGCLLRVRLSIPASRWPARGSSGWPPFARSHTIIYAVLLSSGTLVHEQRYSCNHIIVSEIKPVGMCHVLPGSARQAVLESDAGSGGCSYIILDLRPPATPICDVFTRTPLRFVDADHDGVDEILGGYEADGPGAFLSHAECPAYPVLLKVGARRVSSAHGTTVSNSRSLYDRPRASIYSIRTITRKHPEIIRAWRGRFGAGPTLAEEFERLGCDYLLGKRGRGLISARLKGYGAKTGMPETISQILKSIDEEESALADDNLPR